MAKSPLLIHAFSSLIEGRMNAVLAYEHTGFFNLLAARLLAHEPFRPNEWCLSERGLYELTLREEKQNVPGAKVSEFTLDIRVEDEREGLRMASQAQQVHDSRIAVPRVVSAFVNRGYLPQLKALEKALL